MTKKWPRDYWYTCRLRSLAAFCSVWYGSTLYDLFFGIKRNSLRLSKSVNYVCVFILRSLNYAYRTDSLSVTQKQGIITCIPKPNKSWHFLKNWRRISLLNVIYKLASSVIANRIKSVLDSIVHEDQKGFIAGRFIGENVRLIYDVLFETKQQNIPGLLLSIDFNKHSTLFHGNLFRRL